ncbi:MAG: pilus assembly protein N-terminal domain-containing protein [Verrucomicrobiota bacterium]
MKKYFLFILSFALLTIAAFASTETNAPLTAPVSDAPSTPPEMIVNGKPASQLTDAETQNFLQSKVKNIRQGNLEVRLIRIAPGYPVTLDFAESVKSSSIGDPQLVAAQSPNSKEIILRALARPPGDTTLQVVTRSEKRFIYQLYLAENLKNADLVICVNQGWESSMIYWIKWLLILGVIGFAAYMGYQKIKLTKPKSNI